MRSVQRFGAPSISAKRMSVILSVAGFILLMFIVAIYSTIMTAAAPIRTVVEIMAWCIAFGGWF